MDQNGRGRVLWWICGFATIFSWGAALAAPIITGTDAGPAAHVKAFNGVTLAEEASFFAYGPAFTGGVRVALGDVTGDGLGDIVTGAGPGAGPHVKVFDGLAPSEVRSFFAYGPTFAGGVFVAGGDVTGDGRADIITGAGSTSTHVKVFDAITSAEVRSFLAFGAATLGVRVAAGDVNGDGRADIVAGTAFTPFPGFNGGVRVGAGDLNGDGHADILAATGPGGGVVRAYDGLSFLPIHNFTPYTGFADGIFVAGETPVPEPSALLLACAGIGALGFRRRC
jgi:hypothetical protein